MSNNSKKQFITIENLIWDNYKPRKDVERNSWYKMSNTIQTDQQLHDCLNTYWGTFMFIMGLCSIKKSKFVLVDTFYALKLLKIKSRTFWSAIMYFESKQVFRIVTHSDLRDVDVTQTSRGRDEHGPTDRQTGTNKQTDTRTYDDDTQENGEAKLNFDDKNEIKIPKTDEEVMQYFKAMNGIITKEL